MSEWHDPCWLLNANYLQRRLCKYDYPVPSYLNKMLSCVCMCIFRTVLNLYYMYFDVLGTNISEIKCANKFFLYWRAYLLMWAPQVP